MKKLALLALVIAAAFTVTSCSSGGNSVEPLSNGLLLTMSKGQVLEKFGEPISTSWAGTMYYDDFYVLYSGNGRTIWHFNIKKDSLKLHSGIGIGSSKADVKRVFGFTYQGDYGQYALEFIYTGDMVSEIDISPLPEKEFHPY